MNGKAGDGECGVEAAESVDVVYHGKEDGRGKRSMGSQALEVIGDRDGRRSARVEAGET